MTKRIFLALGGILLFAFVICTSFLWYKVFYYGDIGKINTLQVQKESDEVALNENLVPMTESEAQSVPNYKFSIKNVNDFKSSYKVQFFFATFFFEPSVLYILTQASFCFVLGFSG